MNKSAVNNQEDYTFAYQPIVRALNQTVVGHELLLREFHSLSNRAFLSEPDLFCENLNELVECKAMTMKHLMIECGVEVLFVNFTPDQIAHPNFNQSLSHFYKQGIAPSSVAIEVTEQNYAKDTDAFYENLKAARRNGHPVVVDDFGSGVSNFNHVKELRPSIVKTDKSLLDSAIGDDYCVEFLRNLVNFLRQIGCKVVIEGVETERHLEIANLCDANFLQGYYFGKPISMPSSNHAHLNHAEVISKRLNDLVRRQLTSDFVLA